MANTLKLSAVGLLALLAAGTFAQTATTDPVGFVKVPCLGLSDTFTSAPLTRQPAFTGLLASVSGETLQLQGTPGWTAGQFVYAKGTQTNHYYILIRSGASAGLYYTIVSNQTGSITVDAMGEDLSTLAAGTQIQIIPFQTFATLFPSGAGVAGSSSHSTRATEVFVPSQSAAGINLAPQYTYYYYTGTDAGWRRVGGGLTTVRDDDYVLPDTYFVVRNNVAQSSEVVFVGSVPMGTHATYLSSPRSNAKQDNPIGLTVPADMTLAQSRLFESGAFLGSASHSARGDELLVFDNSAAARNKSPLYTYYYYTGSSPGWRRVGGGLSTVRNTDVVFAPGSGYLVRRASRAAAESKLWSFVPPFAN